MIDLTSKYHKLRNETKGLPSVKYLYLLLTISFLISCGGDNNSNEATQNDLTNIRADVIGVTVEGTESNYTFNVSLKSDETGCDQYADWWEILNENGDLIYRRILAHSHTTEQPFTRSGSPVEILEDDVVYIRAHMHPNGYNGDVFKGTVRGDFIKQETLPTFPTQIETTQPLPEYCAF